MACIQKGDLISARGKHWIASTCDYTKVISSYQNGVDCSTAVGAVKAHPAENPGAEVELILSRENVLLVKKASEL